MTIKYAYNKALEQFFILETVENPILDVKSGHFSYSNAGHNVPFICHENGMVEPVAVHHGFVLARMKNIRYRRQEMVFLPGDKLVLYTDGVTEATNAAYDMYENKSDHD